MSSLTKPYALKDWLANFGRLFALLLNRSLMYQASHPMVRDSLKEVMAALVPVLDRLSTLVFILNRNQFYVDEQALDPRINVKRILDLFKAVGLQSVSFEKGVDQAELDTFCVLFAGLTMASKLDDLKSGLSTRGVFNIKVNHVVYKKVTADDQIVSREALKKVSPFGDAEDPESRRKFMDALLESVLADEVAGTLNISRLLNDPAEFSRHLIDTDLAGARQISGAGSPAAGIAGRPGAPLSAGSAQSGQPALNGAAADMPAGQTESAGAGSMPGPPHGRTAAAGAAGETSGRPGSMGTPSPVQGSFAGQADNGQPASAGATAPLPEDPAMTGLSGGEAPAPASGEARGMLLLHQLDRMEKEVRDHLKGGKPMDLTELAQAILKMKHHLLENLQAQKALGAAYANEEAIVARANQLTDNVLMTLIREEYRTGKFTAARLAVLIRRLIPGADELRRLLPQIKVALLSEGMPAATYMELIRELQNELKGEELVRVLDESAEAIGLDSQSVIDEIRRNPAQAAELIYLASEIRKEKGDDNALSDILVEYVEQLSRRSTAEAGGDTPPDAAHVKKVISDIESTVLKQLSRMNVNDDVLARLDQRLGERMESIMDKMRVEWLNAQSTLKAQSSVKPLTLLQMLEQSAAADDELSAILAKVRRKVEAGKIPENDFSQIQAEIEQQKRKLGESGQTTLPAEVLSADELMFILEKEIARCKRHGVPFAALAFSFVTAQSKLKALQELVNAESVVSAALEKLTHVFREMDYIGQIGRNKMLVILPMAGAVQAKKALSRVMHALHSNPLTVNEVQVNIRVAGVAAAYEAECAMDAQTFSRHLSNQLMDMVARVKNIQVLF